MKRKFVPVLLIVLTLLAFFPVVAFAQGETPPAATTLDIILSVFLMFGTLAGVAAAISALVNVFKAFGIVTDSTAGKWVAGLNLVAIVGLIYVKLFQPEILIETIDAQAAVFAQIALIVLGYIVQLGFGTFTHGVLSKLRLPYVGTSFSQAPLKASKPVKS